MPNAKHHGMTGCIKGGRHRSPFSHAIFAAAIYGCVASFACPITAPRSTAWADDAGASVLAPLNDPMAREDLLELASEDLDVPRYVSVGTLEMADDAGDTRTLEVLIEDGMLRTVAPDEQATWRSPDDWVVLDATLGRIPVGARSFANNTSNADLDGNDSAPTVLAMIVWRRANFGNNAPFWIDDPKVHEELIPHLYTYTWDGTAFHPLWMGSDLGMRARTVDITPQGHVTVGTSDDHELELAWHGWGFEVVSWDGQAQGDATVPSDASGADGGNGMDRDEDGVTLSEATLLFVGDNIAHLSVYRPAWDPETGAYEFGDIYADAEKTISAYDLAFVVQETALVPTGLESGYPRFGTPDSMADVLIDAGFDVICCATNHVLDKGMQGLVHTLNYWEANFPQVTLLGIHADEAGAGRPTFREVNGIRLAMFDLTYDLNGITLPQGSEFAVDTVDDLDSIRAMITGSIPLSDLRICVVHAGDEYVDEPSAQQEDIVDALIDAGADIVICSHTHVVGPWGTRTTEAGNQALVYWGLGNFMSGQDQPGTTTGAAASITVSKSKATGEAGVSKVETAALLTTSCTYVEGVGFHVVIQDPEDGSGLPD